MNMQQNIQDLARAELKRRELQLAQKGEAERDLLAFVRMMWFILEPETPFVEGWVLETMCDALMAVTDGHAKRIIINVFPGAMKSLLLNVFWPAWEWGPCNMPWMRYISVSYATSLPERDNSRFQRLINHPLYQKCWGDRVKVDKDSVEMVENNRTGWKRVLSIGGTTTGWRGNRVLIDDANNPMSVESDDVRHSTNIWLREVMPDRLNNMDDDAIINIQQRTHLQDATETLVQSWEGSDFVWVSVPFEFDPLRISSAVFRHEEDGTPLETWTDPRSLDIEGNQLEGLFNDEKGELRVRMGSPMAKAEGELAWPARISEEAWAILKKSKAAYAVAGQYQQSPTIRGGGIIRRDWWQIWTGKSYPELGTVVAALDTAQEEHKEADYNALTTWGAFPGQNGEPQLIMTAAWKDRLPLAQLVARVAEICRERKVDYLLIEHKTRGRDVHDEIVRLYQNASWQTILVPIKGDKTSRLNSVSHLFSGDVRKDPVTGLDTWSGGMIYAPDTQWADDVINEVGAFPRAPHDDYVDTVSMALSWMRKNGVVLRKVEYDDQETDRKKFRRTQQVPYAI